MNEKRFELRESVLADYQIYDNKQDDAYSISCPKYIADHLVDLLNSLSKEMEGWKTLAEHFSKECNVLQKENERKTNEIKLLRKQYSKIPKNIREVWKE